MILHEPPRSAACFSYTNSRRLLSSAAECQETTTKILDEIFLKAVLAVWWSSTSRRCGEEVAFLRTHRGAILTHPPLLDPQVRSTGQVS